MANSSDAGTAAATMKEESVSLDMVYEILSRVSAVSVLRLKSVCKLWSSVAEDSYFMDMHLERSKSRPSQIILHASDGIILLNDRWLPKLTFRSPYIDHCFHNTRPCNGLICLYGEYTGILLCNPATGALQVLPNPIQDTKQFCCLGFVPTTKKYKVLRIFPTRGLHLRCEVLTVGSSSWRRVGDVNCRVSGKGVNLDGAIYLIGLMPPSWDAHLFRFDLAAEDFDTVKLPGLVQYETLQTQLLDLVLRGGKLCLLKRLCAGPLFTFTLRGDYKNNAWDIDFHAMERSIPRRASCVGENGLLYTTPVSHFRLLEEVYHSIGLVTDVYEFEESLVPLEKSAMHVQSRLHSSLQHLGSVTPRTVGV